MPLNKGKMPHKTSYEQYWRLNPGLYRPGHPQNWRHRNVINAQRISGRYRDPDNNIIRLLTNQNPFGRRERSQIAFRRAWLESQDSYFRREYIGPFGLQRPRHEPYYRTVDLHSRNPFLHAEHLHPGWHRMATRIQSMARGAASREHTRHSNAFVNWASNY